MADGFVQQHAGPAGAEHDFHLACGRGNCIQLQDGLARGFLRKALGRLLREEVVELHAAAAAGAAACDVCAILRDDEDVEARERLRVGGEGAIRCGDQDAAHLVGEAGAHLHDARIGRARGTVGAEQQVELGGDVGIAFRREDRIEILLAPFRGSR